MFTVHSFRALELHLFPYSLFFQVFLFISFHLCYTHQLSHLIPYSQTHDISFPSIYFELSSLANTWDIQFRPCWARSYSLQVTVWSANRHYITGHPSPFILNLASKFPTCFFTSLIRPFIKILNIQGDITHTCLTHTPRSKLSLTPYSTYFPSNKKPWPLSLYPHP